MKLTLVVSHCSEFCHHELSKRDFKSAVDRLNANVLHLCFTQVRKTPCHYFGGKMAEPIKAISQQNVPFAANGHTV